MDQNSRSILAPVWKLVLYCPHCGITAVKSFWEEKTLCRFTGDTSHRVSCWGQREFTENNWLRPETLYLTTIFTLFGLIFVLIFHLFCIHVLDYRLLLLVVISVFLCLMPACKPNFLQLRFSSFNSDKSEDAETGIFLSRQQVDLVFKLVYRSCRF